MEEETGGNTAAVTRCNPRQPQAVTSAHRPAVELLDQTVQLLALPRLHRQALQTGQGEAGGGRQLGYTR